MGYGLVKLPKLAMAVRSLRIKLNWAYFTVSYYDEMKKDTTFKLEEAIWIIENFKERLTGSQNLVQEFRILKKVESEIHKPLYDFLEKRGKGVKDRTNPQKKFMKGEINKNSLVKLNKIVKKANFEYKASCTNLEREIISALYFEDLLRAVSTKGRHLDPMWEKFYDKPNIFKLFSCLGNCLN